MSLIVNNKFETRLSLDTVPANCDDKANDTQCIVKLGKLSSASKSEGFFTQTKRTDWMILSPPLKKNIGKQIEQVPVVSGQYYNYLSELGKRATAIWKGAISQEEKAEEISLLLNGLDRFFLKNIIDEILDSDELLGKIAKASYRNVTGFLKIVLAEEGSNGWKMRLHSWNQNGPKEFPHNHKWDFYSKIISGYLSQDVYEKTKNRNGVQHEIREPASLMPLLPSGELPCPCRDNYELQSKGLNNVFLINKSTDRMGIGESYFFPNHLIHTIVPSKGAISFVFTSPKVKNNSDVFIPLNRLSEDLTKFAPSITKEELREELLQIKKILGYLYIQERYLPEIADVNCSYFESSDPIYSSRNWREDIQTNIVSGKKRVLQRSELDLEKYFVGSKDGVLTIGGILIDPSKQYLFVQMDEGMYAAEKDFHHDGNLIICHSTFTEYGPAISAGIFHFAKNLSLQEIEAYSGHYHPSMIHMELTKNYLASIGVDVSSVKLSFHSDR